MKVSETELRRLIEREDTEMAALRESMRAEIHAVEARYWDRMAHCEERKRLYAEQIEKESRAHAA